MTLRMNLPLYTDIEFQDSHSWRDNWSAWGDACEAENLIANRLATLPLGTLLRASEASTSGWMLWPHDEQRKMAVFCIPELDGDLDTIQARCDIGLEWVDVEVDELLHYASECRQAIESGVVSAAPAEIINFLLQQHHRVLMRELYFAHLDIKRERGLCGTEEFDKQLSVFLGKDLAPEIAESAHAIIVGHYRSHGFIPKGSAVEAVEEIGRLLARAHSLWQGLPPQMQDELNAVHTPDTTLGHCLRWGKNTAEDLSTRLGPKAKEQKTEQDAPIAP